MNETIKQLCEQSKVYANESTKDFTGNEPVVWMDYYTEKFAELIVRECAEVADNADVMRQKWEGIGKYIKEHFGVEEC